MQLSIHTTPKTETKLREIGLVFPDYPETGSVSFSEQSVGHVDNFNGITLPKSFEFLLSVHSISYWKVL